MLVGHGSSFGIASTYFRVTDSKLKALSISISNFVIQILCCKHFVLLAYPLSLDVAAFHIVCNAIACVIGVKVSLALQGIGLTLG